MAGVGAVGVGENEREGAQGGAGVLVHRREGERARACRRVIRGGEALLSIWLMKPVLSGLNEGVSERATVVSKVVSWLELHLSGTLMESAPALSASCLPCL